MAVSLRVAEGGGGGCEQFNMIYMHCVGYSILLMGYQELVWDSCDSACVRPIWVQHPDEIIRGSSKQDVTEGEGILIGEEQACYRRVVGGVASSKRTLKGV